MRHADALTVARGIAGGGERNFQFMTDDTYIYWNMQTDGKWYFALWMNDARPVCADLEFSPPMTKTIVHVSLFKGILPSEQVAFQVVDCLRRALAKAKMDSKNFQCLCKLNEEDSESDYALLDLQVSCRLYQTCHKLVKDAFQDQYYCYNLHCYYLLLVRRRRRRRRRRLLLLLLLLLFQRLTAHAAHPRM
jgi:hypothetical protein